MNKYLIGSRLLGLDKSHDIDYLQIVESGDVTLYKRQLIEGDDILTRSTANISRQMNFEFPIDRKTATYYIINYQLDQNIIGQQFPYEYHVLDKKKEYIKLLNYIVNNQLMNFTKEININNGHCSKILYHVAYLTFIMENNSTVLTAEQKEIVQKIHDKQMSVKYLDVLEEKIRNLK